jgi:hypothetical protein
LTAAVAAGSLLALCFMRDISKPLLGALHGALGAAGLALLLLTLQGPRRGEAMGVGSFGFFAAVLLALALVFGLFVLLLLRRASPAAGFMIAVHATMAITGYVLLLAWVSV